jgi:hypothetical protein
MSISVRCEECAKTYQVRDEMAGRRGKCPKGHAIHVPATDAAPAATVVEANEFAFTDAAPTNPRTGRRPRPTMIQEPEPETEPLPEPAAAGDDFSAFPTKVAGSTVRTEDRPAPSTGRHRRPEAKAGKEGKPNLMPLYLGGILAVLGIGGGVTTLVMSRSEVKPLREQAEAATKKAADAEERAKAAELQKAVAETNLETLKKNPPRDPALTKALSDLKAAEKRAADAERKLAAAPAKEGAGGEAMAGAKADLDPTAPGGKSDPVMPNGKLDGAKPADKKTEAMKPADKKMDEKKPEEKKADAGPPKAGKSYQVPATISLTGLGLKAGDRLWVSPRDDAVVKAEGSKLTVKFRWQLRQNRDLPKDAHVALLFEESKMVTALYTPVKLAGTGGDAEAAFTIRGAAGKMKVHILVCDGKGEPSGKGLQSQSNLLTLQAEFEPRQ